MSDLMTHVVAILVGVGITLCLVGAYNNATTATASSSSSKNNTSNKTATTTSAAGSSASGGGGSNKSKRNKKKNKKSTAAAAVVVASPPQSAFENVPAIPDEPVVVVVEKKKAAVAVPQQQNGGGGGGKKKKKNKKMTVVKSSSTASTIPSANLTNTEPTPQKSKPKVKTPVVSAPIIPSEGPGPLQPRIIVEEEWATIPVQKKKNKKMKQPANGGGGANGAGANGATTTTPAVVVSERVTIDSSRVGIIIGPKGATMNAIQEKTGVKLDVNAPKLDDAAGSSNGGGNNQFRPVRGGMMKKQTATVIITGGTNESRVIAKKAILELADRGYSSLLMGDQFGESTVTVHPRFLSNIVGPGGKIIKLIQSECNVKLTIPKNVDWTPKTIQVGNVLPTCRVGIAGDDVKNVKLAKQVIKDLCTYHYHSITHPGFTHQELYVPQEFFHCVIGPRGSEIKHIRGNYKVDVYIPNNESITENIICVGKSNDVEKAISYIKLLMERDTELREAKYSDEQYGNNDADGW